MSRMKATSCRQIINCSSSAINPTVSIAFSHTCMPRVPLGCQLAAWAPGVNFRDFSIDS